MLVLFKYCIFFLLFILSVFDTEAQKGLHIAKKTPPKASIVANAKTGDILYASNPDLQTQPASMTKMMTLKLLFKALKAKKITLNTHIKISKKAMSQRPCKIGFKEGETITVRDAVLALITRSANDVAVAVAEHLGGSEKRFVAMMNAEARRLRMYSTVFRNASGWKDTAQLTTVRDMLRLSRSLIAEYPDYFHFFATKLFYYKGQLHKNHNSLLGENGGITVDGLKTGYVTASGYNIAVSARKGKDQLIAVVVGGESAKKRDNLVQWLLASSFNKLAEQKRYEEAMRRNSCTLKILHAKAKKQAAKNRQQQPRQKKNVQMAKSMKSLTQKILENHAAEFNKNPAAATADGNKKAVFEKQTVYNKIISSDNSIKDR